MIFDGLMEAMRFFRLREGVEITANQSDTYNFEEGTVRLIPAWEYFMS